MAVATAESILGISDIAYSVTYFLKIYVGADLGTEGQNLQTFFSLANFGREGLVAIHFTNQQEGNGPIDLHRYNIQLNYEMCR